MNVRDSEAVATALIKAGYKISSSENDADILLFNTCSVRDQAERKAIGKIGILKKLKKNKPELLIGIMGCMAQSRKEKILDELPHVDFVLGTDQLQNLIPVLEDLLRKREKIVKVETSDDIESFDGINGHLGCPDKNTTFYDSEIHNHNTNSCCAFISLMRGCDRFCSYCIVPYVRGREKSRKHSSVIDEIKNLVDSGVKEIMLLGQNIAAYNLKESKKELKHEESPFAELLERISEINGLMRIRFTSPHPAYFNDRLINTVISLPKVCDNIHLPLQSGSDKILHLMKRGYSSSTYLNIVNKLRQKSPEMTFSTDIIVGYPHEEEEDFNATRNLMNEVGFDNAFIFKYSPRQGTSAAKMKDSIPTAVKEKRNALLLNDLKSRTALHNRQFEGKTAAVLVEGISKRNSEKWFGRTTNNKVVVFSPYNNVQKGDIVDILIERSTSVTLFGKKL